MKRSAFRNVDRKIALTGAILLAAGVAVAGLTAFGPPFTAGEGWAQSQASNHAAVDFNRDIAPIFQSSCVKCHGGDSAQAGLRLDSEAGILKGGVSGRTIVPGHSGDSLIVKR